MLSVPDLSSLRASHFTGPEINQSHGVLAALDILTSQTRKRKSLSYFISTAHTYVLIPWPLLRVSCLKNRLIME